MSLPEPVPPKLVRILDQLGDQERDLVELRLQTGFSAEQIAFALCRIGHPISASTLRTYRRRIFHGRSVS